MARHSTLCALLAVVWFSSLTEISAWRVRFGTSRTMCFTGLWNCRPAAKPTHCSQQQTGLGSFGYVRCTGNVIGASCSITCSKGFRSSSSTTISCKPDGNWSGRLTCAAVQCPSPPAIANGNARCSSPLLNSSPLMGSTCTYTCNAGWVVPLSQRNRVVTCTASRTWNGVAPTCIRAPCSQLPAPANGALVCGPSQGGGIFCMQQCRAGYDLPYRAPNMVPGYGSFVCHANKAWTPTSNVYGCYQNTRPPRVPLPASMYYRNSCLSAQPQMKQAFISYLSSTRLLNVFCPGCSAADLTVYCGPTTPAPPPSRG